MTGYRRKLGCTGEQTAARHLAESGYTILETNYATRFAEIDIIAATEDCLVFVEVKTRANLKKGLPGKRSIPPNSTKSSRRPSIT